MSAVKKNTPRKRLVIVNQTRFVIASVLSLIILSILFTYMAGLFISDASTHTDFIEIRVVEGDTLWRIALNHNYYNEDPRAVVHRIKRFNTLSSADIVAGQALFIPLK